METLEELFVKEYEDLKDKNAKLEKENKDLKSLCISLQNEKKCFLALLSGGYSTPSITNDEEGNIVSIYVSGNILYRQDDDRVDAILLKRIADEIQQANAIKIKK